MSARTWFPILGLSLGLVIQGHWLSGHWPDSQWHLRLLGGALLGWFLFWGISRGYERIKGRAFWPGLAKMQERLASPRVFVFIAFAFFLLVFLLSTGGRFYSYDDTLRYRATKAMLEQGNLVVDQTARGEPIQLKYGILHPLLDVPLYLIGKQFKAPSPKLEKFDEVICATLMQIITALAATVVLLLLLDLGYSRRISLGVACVFAFATLAWPYAKFHFSEPLNGLLVLLALWQLQRYAQSQANRHLFWAGVSLGLGVVNSLMLLVTAVPLLGLWALWLLRPGQKGGPVNWGESLARLLFFGLPICAGLAVVLGLNQYKYGSPFITGYEGDRGFANPVYDGTPGFSLSPWVGIHGLLLSPGKSVFLYSPPLILALWGWRSWAARHQAMGWMPLLLCLAWLAFYSRWWAWHGDIAWGPRYLAPIMALACLPLARVFASWPERGRLFKAFGLGLIILGVGVQVLALTLPPDYYFLSQADPKQATWHLLHYVPHYSPILGQIKMLAQASRLEFYFQHTPLALPLALLALACGHMAWLGALAPEPKGPDQEASPPA